MPSVQVIGGLSSEYLTEMWRLKFTAALTFTLSVFSLRMLYTTLQRVFNESTKFEYIRRFTSAHHTFCAGACRHGNVGLVYISVMHLNIIQVTVMSYFNFTPLCALHRHLVDDHIRWYSRSAFH